MNLAEDFNTFAAEYYNRRYESGDIAFHTWANSLSRLRDFSSFLERKGYGKAIGFGTITDSLLQKYKQDCLARGNAATTVNRKLLPLLMAVRQAGKEGLMNPETVLRLSSPYLKSSKNLYRGADETDPVRFLSQQQLASLVTYYEQLPSGRRRDVLDVFLFSFHACGLRISDIITLEWRHINEKESILTKTLVKTHGRLVIPLSAQAMDILGRWKREGRNPRFVFDLLPPDFDYSDRGALEKAIDNRNRRIRAVLNAVGRELEFPFPLGMHVARHTFALMALNASRVDVHLISRLLGHASVTITEKVYATFLMPTLSKELRSHLSFPEFGVIAKKEGG